METKCTLNNAEQIFVGVMAELRHAKNRSLGVKNQLVNPRDPLFFERIGFGGEVAFAKLANCYPDFTTHVRTGGHDVITRKGNKIDVKTTTYTPCTLKVRCDKISNDIDLYVLMQCEWPAFEMIGFLHKDEINKERYVKNRKGEDWFVIPREELRTEWT